MPDREVWQRQKGESSQAFEAFKIYRDMGLTRSISKVSQELSKSETLLKRWSRKWEWVERVKHYDAEMDRRDLLEQEKKRRDMAKRHANQATMFQKKVLERMQEFDVSQLTPNDLIRWFETSVKIERLSRGESTDITELEHGGEIKEQHEHNLNKRIEQYIGVYEKSYEDEAFRDRTQESYNEGNDT